MSFKQCLICLMLKLTNRCHIDCRYIELSKSRIILSCMVIIPVKPIHSVQLLAVVQFVLNIQATWSVSVNLHRLIYKILSLQLFPPNINPIKDLIMSLFILNSAIIISFIISKTTWYFGVMSVTIII